jgi:transposase InsO family protein
MSSTPASPGTTSGSSGTTPSPNIPLQNFISDSAWPADLILDGLKHNWEQWDRRLNLVADQRHFSKYLNGKLKCPDATAHPTAADNWESNNRALRGFILEHVSDHDYGLASIHDNAHDVYSALRKHHLLQGPHAQIDIMKELLEIRFLPTVSLTRTLDEIDKLHERYTKMGKMDDDKFKIILILNALGTHFQRLQTSITDMLESPSINSADIKKRIVREEQLLISREKHGHTPAADNTALAAITNNKPKTPCSNCKRTNHRTECCIAPGGQMAGKTIEEARAANDAARRALGLPVRQRGTRPGDNTSTPAPQKGNTTAPTPQSSAKTITINGKCYMETSAAPKANSALAAISMASYDEEEYVAVLATTEPPVTSLDWNVDHAAYSVARSTTALDTELPFILDTGATCHISPEASDFKVLKSIPRHPVKGLGGSAVYATGMGDIDLRIAAGHTLKLTNVLYIPESKVRLISILALNKGGNYTTHFDSGGCWVTNKSNTVLVRGSLSTSKRLYVLTTKTPFSQKPMATSDSVLYTRVPDIETWHRRLGHCNTRAIVEMAKSGVTQGMPIDLSSLPPTCDHCAIGKQSRSPVPKAREGIKSDKRLGRVYVDLCGPMAVTSRSGNLYSMNVIDDFSGYVWTIPLRSKAEAFSAIRTWHKAVTVQTGEILRILVTDNGELVSNATRDWCQIEGIDHQLTAPHTSAQNGRAERLHRTILGKARAMRLACNAPGFLWDEFCATAAYLTNLTAATANKGRTPYELWFDRTPSLSHLREIGCRAFCLQQPPPSKIYACSTPCILIGYAPHSKAYRLWDPSTSRVFNSFHVSFTEHLDAEPKDLLPGTILGTDSAASPPSWDVNGPVPPSDPTPPHPFSSLPPTSPSTLISTTTTSNNVNSRIDTNDNNENRTTTNTANSRLDNNNNNAHSSVDPPRITITPPSPLNDDTPPSNNEDDPPPPDPSDTNPPPPPLTITIPPRRRSPRLQERDQTSDTNDYALAFLAEYSPIRDTHDLFPANICVEDPNLTVDEVLAALSDGSLEPTPDHGDEPLWAQAMASDEREYWIAGARDELQSLQDLKVFVLVPRTDLPRGQRPLKGKLVCKRKRDDTGRIVRYKVRYVAKGFAQRYGIDYDKTTAPTVRLEAFRAILHIAATLDWDLKQFDIKTAFLHGILPDDETMYMQQPPGFETPGKEDWVMQLKKSIYGMKQAGRIWNQTFHKTVTEWGFERLQCEWCIYRRDSPTGTVMFAVHVDDIIAAASSADENAQFRDFLKSKWQITELGEPKLALGITISRNRPNRTISLSSTPKIDELIEEYGQTDAHPADTPMVAGLQLRRPDKATLTSPEIVEWAERTPYRKLVGSLMYLAVATRPDISYAVSRLSTFLDCYSPEHWAAAIRVLRYLKGTRAHVLVLGGKNSLNLSGYSDSDYANCLDTSRSVGGYCFTLGSGMVSWTSRKQKTVADSSCYAEYIALHEASHEIVFLRQLLEGLHFLPSGATQLLCDNDAASRLSEDHVWHSHTKHVRVKYHYIRELVNAGDVSVERVGTKDNTADILTKPLARVDFQRLRHYLGVRPLATDARREEEC